jgi:NitT/TauT family transport system ATP-binding protein
VLVMSGHPGRIVADIPVPLGHPRPPEARYDPAMVAVAAQVSAVLRAAATGGEVSAR